MKIDVAKTYGVAKWHKMGDEEDAPEFLIRTMPASEQNFILKSDGSVVFSGQERLRKFAYCLIDCKRVIDAEDAPIQLNDEIKKILFDTEAGNIPSFVFSTVTEMEQEEAQDLKN